MAKVNDYIPLHYVGRRTPVRVNTGTETRVEQCHQETTNINKIIARYRTSGVLPAGREGRYEDVSQVGDLLDVKLQIEEMQNMYESLPNNIKEKLPFADIGNVDNETLSELFNEQFNKSTNEDNRQPTPDAAAGGDKNDGGSTGQSQQSPPAESTE